MKEFSLNQPGPIVGKPIFLLLWIGINIGGWAVWLVFSTIPIVVDTADLQSSNVLSYIGLFIIGGGVGFLQWFFLKRHFSIIWYEWLTLTIIGFAVGLYSLIWTALLDRYIVIGPPGSPLLEWDPLLGGALLGLALGCCQSLAWRPRSGRMVVWIVGNVFGWSLGMFLPQWIAFQSGSDGTPWLSTLIPVGLSALVTGLVLVGFRKEN